MKWVLFLDDLRDVCDVPQAKKFAYQILVARDSDAAFNMVLKHGIPFYMFLDHDLGGDDTTMRFLHRLIEHDQKNDIIKQQFDFHIHSANPVGAANIKGLLASYFEFKFNQKI